MLKGNLNGSAIAGTVRFEQASLNEPVKVTVNITGLQKGSGATKHGLHVHQSGIIDTSDVLSQSK